MEELRYQRACVDPTVGKELRRHRVAAMKLTRYFVAILVRLGISKKTVIYQVGDPILLNPEDGVEL